MKGREPIWVHLTRFSTPAQEGRIARFRDSAQLRHAVIPLFQALILVCIYVGFTSFPRRRACVSWLGKCGRISGPLWVSCKVRLILLLNVVLIFFIDRFKLVVLYQKPSAPQGASLQSCPAFKAGSAPGLPLPPPLRGGRPVFSGNVFCLRIPCMFALLP